MFGSPIYTFIAIHTPLTLTLRAAVRKPLCRMNPTARRARLHAPCRGDFK